MLSGTVQTEAGNPIASAMVSLGRAESSIPAAQTTAQGAFRIRAPGPGAFTLTVAKPGFRALVTRVELSAGAENRVALTLHELNSNALSGAKSASDLEFSDQPNFSVAGVTDAASVGGHGSTATLPVSESLARETVRLKSDDARATPVDGQLSEKQLRAAVERAPRSFSAQHQLGAFYLGAGKPQAAIAPLAAAYRLDPGDYDNAYKLALAYQRSGDLLQARRYVSEVLAKENRADLYRLLGDIDEQLKEPVAAVKEYELAVRLEPSEANYFAWGSELLLHRAIQPAIEVLSQGAKAFPGSARMLAGLGAALYAGGSVEAATERLCQASDLAPNAEAPHLFLGKVVESVVRTPACAQEKLGRFRALQPGNAWAHYYYALALAKQTERIDEPAHGEGIERLLRQAIAIDPQLAAAYLELGVLEGERGNLKQAIAYYQHAVQAKADLAEAHYRLARAYKQSGETDKARQEFDSYRQIEKRQAAEGERERRELREFVVVLKQPASEPASRQEH